jgi:hypothetical protein
MEDDNTAFVRFKDATLIESFYVLYFLFCKVSHAYTRLDVNASKPL